jgi:hypothetical protein
MYSKIYWIIIIVILPVWLTVGVYPAYGQDDLLEMLEEENDSDQTFDVFSTFKGTRLINGHSVETRKQGTLEFIISHRFGRINSGVHNLFGLDDANIRFGLDYAFTDKFTLGFGRSSFQKVYDGFLKYKVLNQKSGNPMPFSLTLYSNISINTLEWPNPGDNRSTDRFAYTNQLLIARKWSEGTSLQLMPTLVHRNRVPTSQEENLIYALGIGGRQKLTKSLAITFEYYHQFNNESLNNYKNSIAIGLDIETGGHVFQLHLTNARPTFERGFITETTGDFFEGDIHFGFNITRAFQLKR